MWSCVQPLPVTFLNSWPTITLNSAEVIRMWSWLPVFIAKASQLMTLSPFGLMPLFHQTIVKELDRAIGLTILIGEIAILRCLFLRNIVKTSVVWIFAMSVSKKTMNSNCTATFPTLTTMSFFFLLTMTKILFFDRKLCY